MFILAGGFDEAVEAFGTVTMASYLYHFFGVKVLETGYTFPD